MTLLSFGEVLWDVYPDRQTLGGAPLNVAAHAARHGMDVYMLSAVGEDALGTQALEQMRAWGVHTEAVRVLPDKPTGRCDVTLDEHAVPSYHLAENVAWDAIVCESLPCKAQALYFGTLALRCEHNAAQLGALLARERFEQVVADVNLRAPFYSPQTVRFVFEHATVIKISDEELPTVCALLAVPLQDNEARCRCLCERFTNLRVVILTCGDKGACAYDAKEDAWYTTAAVNTEVVSTVGAGDSFCAAFLYQFSRGATMEECLSYAAALAAFVVSKYEAIPAYTVSGELFTIDGR